MFNNINMSHVDIILNKANSYSTYAETCTVHNGKVWKDAGYEMILTHIARVKWSHKSCTNLKNILFECAWIIKPVS